MTKKTKKKCYCDGWARKMCSTSFEIMAAVTFDCPQHGRVRLEAKEPIIKVAQEPEGPVVGSSFDY